MTEKRSKYDTDPLDPDFVRRAEEAMKRTRADETEPLPPASVTEEQTRRFDEQMTDSYPSVFVPPAYQPPRPAPPPYASAPPPPPPFTTFGSGPHQPPARTEAPPPGPSSPYPGPFQPHARPTSRTVAGLNMPEHVAVVLPYIPFFYVGLIAAFVELFMTHRGETRTRFHAAQGLALQLVVLVGTIFFRFISFATGNSAGAKLFYLASLVYLVISAIRVWQGKPHHISALDEPARWLDERLPPSK